MSQTSYAEQAVAFAGLIGDISRGMLIDSGMQGEVSAAIPFGKFVVPLSGMLIDSAIVSGNSRGTPAIFALPTASTDDFKGGGVVVHSHDYDKRLDLNTVGVLPKKQIGVMTRGRIWVVSGTAFAVTDSVYVQYTAGIAAVGDIANASDSGKNVLLYGARVLTAIAATGLALLELDMGAHRAH